MSFGFAYWDLLSHCPRLLLPLGSVRPQHGVSEHVPRFVQHLISLWGQSSALYPFICQRVIHFQHRREVPVTAYKTKTQRWFFQCLSSACWVLLLPKIHWLFELCQVFQDRVSMLICSCSQFDSAPRISETKSAVFLPPLCCRMSGAIILSAAIVHTPASLGRSSRRCALHSDVAGATVFNPHFCCVSLAR